jgi:hypothetical protein
MRPHASVCSAQWPGVFAGLADRVARRFARTQVRGRLRRSFFGLRDRVERKNGRQLAAAIGGADPQPAKGAPGQRRLRTTRCDADRVHDESRDDVLAHLGDAAVIRRSPRAVGRRGI